MDDAIKHLLNWQSGGQNRRDEDDAAVTQLLAADPSNGHRQPSHQDNDAVQFLAGLTRAELRKQGR